MMLNFSSPTSLAAGAFPGIALDFGSNGWSESPEPWQRVGSQTAPGQFDDSIATQGDIEARRRAARFGNFMGLNPVVRQAISGLAGTLSPEASLRAIDEATAAQNSMRASNVPGQAQDPRFMSAEAILAAVPTLRRQLGGGASAEVRGPDFTPQGGGRPIDFNSQARSPMVGGGNVPGTRSLSQPRWQAGRSDVVDNPGGPALAISPDGTVYPTAGNYGAYQRLQASTGAREGANGRLNFEDLLGTVRRNEAAGLPTPTGTGIGALDSMAGAQAMRREDELRQDERTYAEQQRRIQREEARNDEVRRQQREDKLIKDGINPRGTSTTAKPNYAGENYDAKFQREQQVLAQQAEAAARQGWLQAEVTPGKPTDVEVRIGKSPFKVRVPADLPPDQAQAYVAEEAMRLAGVLPQQAAPPAPAPADSAPVVNGLSDEVVGDMRDAKAKGYSADDYIRERRVAPGLQAKVRAFFAQEGALRADRSAR